MKSEAQHRLIIMPMQEELDLFVEACTKREFRTISSVVGKLPVVELPDLDMAVARGGTGKAQFAVQTQHLLEAKAWDLVICAGAAGAIADGVSVGDIVVAVETVEHDYKNRFNDNPVPTFYGSGEAISRIRQGLPMSKEFNVHFGTVASGDEDVIDEKRRRTLLEATGALAVAWEGAGGARACRFSNVPYVEIRGVTDIAGSSSPSEFQRNLESAMTNLATFTTTWLTQSA